MKLTETQIFAIERPHPRLFMLYLVRAVLSGPLLLFVLPYYFFRYHTLHYRFDDEGIHMRWGILFRREINLTYARIQDIHLTSGIIQRWFGLADVQIQTASGSSTAEMTIEGLLEYETIRDFLYSRMRGYREQLHSVQPPAVQPPEISPHPTNALTNGPQAVVLLREMIEEIRATRHALESVAESRRTPQKQAENV